jgi:hypothetical protein
MEDGRRTLIDVSEAANNMNRKIVPQAAAAPVAAPAPAPAPRRPEQKRQ